MSLAQRGWETVPDPGSSDSETPITERTVGASNNEHRSIRRSKRAPTGVRDELTVVSKVPWQLTYGTAAPALTLRVAGLAANGADEIQYDV